jgi:predicted 2-oxoglutarate/Fe(II)-dependent dioxygenase YbiX
MVYYPNDDYEGGELEFIHFGVKVKPKAGQLFLFPSSYIYEHRITDIGDGEPRYTIVAFFCNIDELEKQKRLNRLPNPYKAQLKYISELNKKQFTIEETQ